MTKTESQKWAAYAKEATDAAMDAAQKGNWGESIDLGYRAEDARHRASEAWWSDFLAVEDAHQEAVWKTPGLDPESLYA